MRKMALSWNYMVWESANSRISQAEHGQDKNQLKRGQSADFQARSSRGLNKAKLDEGVPFF